MPGCGLDAESCILEHWVPRLDGRKERHQESGTWRWRASCPRCRSDRAIWYWLAGKYVRWRLYCSCEQADVRRNLYELLPGCVEVRYRGRHRVEASELEELAEDRTLPELALRVAMFDLAGIGLRDACDRLGVSRAQRYRIVSQVRHRRRS